MGSHLLHCASRQRQKPCVCLAGAGAALVENRLEDVASPHAVRCGPARTQSAQAWFLGASAGQPACCGQNLKTLSGKNPPRAILKSQVPVWTVLVNGGAANRTTGAKRLC